MKTAKLIVGIVSIVLTFLVMVQSCAAVVGDALIDEGGTGGGVGIIVAILMLIAGITAIAARNSRGGTLFCTILYVIGGVVGLTMNGIYGDLQIWGGLCLVFALIFLVSLVHRKQEKDGNSSEIN